MKSEIEILIQTVACLESRGTAARSSGDESAADASLREALRLTSEQLDRADFDSGEEKFLDVLKIHVRLSLRCGEVLQAKQGLQTARASNPLIAESEEWSRFFAVSKWPDEWLLAAVRRDPPDAAALDVLVDRYWKEVFGRCYLLTVNYDKAGDLAQQAWVRVLRARQRLLPGGNFPAYVSAVATNLWRDAQRWSRRAGPVAEHNLLSHDQPIWQDESADILLADTLPDVNSADPLTRAMLKIDIDHALEGLSAKHRDVLIARFIAGESCAEIGKRYGRTEQTISGWIREAIEQMKTLLEDPVPAATLADASLV